MVSVSVNSGRFPQSGQSLPNRSQTYPVAEAANAKRGAAGRRAAERKRAERAISMRFPSFYIAPTLYSPARGTADRRLIVLRMVIES